jgi:HAD superfamily phosphatase (TIGR01681 family)
MTIKVAIFDLDDTLIHEGFEEFRDEHSTLCDDTIQVLDTLRGKGIKIALASHNYGAESMLKDLNLFDYFCTIQAYYDDTDKKSHINKILKELNVVPKEVVFFDDLIENIESISGLGIKSIQVSWEHGVKLSDIKFLEGAVPAPLTPRSFH